jgi:hypothetical protein
MFITRKSIVAPLPAQAEQKIGVGGDRCLRLRFRLDQRIAHAVLERVARAVSHGRVFDVGMRLHHRAAGAQEPIRFAQIVLQLASGRCVRVNWRTRGRRGCRRAGCDRPIGFVVNPCLKSDRDRRRLLTALLGEEVALNLCRPRRVCPLSLARRRQWRSVREASCASGEFGQTIRSHASHTEDRKGRAKLSSWPSGSIKWKKRSPHSASRGAVAGWHPTASARS